MKLKLIKGWPLAPTIGLILTVATGVILLDFKAGAKLRTLSYDLLLVKRPVQLPPEAVIVYLDEISHQELNQSLNAPWDRALHAKLLDRLTAAGARAVAFDIFSVPRIQTARRRMRNSSPPSSATGVSSWRPTKSPPATSSRN